MGYYRLIKTGSFLLFFILCIGTLNAQNLKGIVYDETTREPIYNATVYLEGTSIHTITDERGCFDFSVKRQIQTKLIISHIGYETKAIDEPFKAMPDTIFITEQENWLGEVVVSKKQERYNREQCLKAFREQFLGSSRAAKSCKILNEDDIVVFYEEKERTLLAYCSQPIRIENSHLGYTILYDLIAFQAEYNVNTLNVKNTKFFLLEGTPLFIDQKANHPPTQKNRRNIYIDSRNHFFKSLKENKLVENDYVLYYGRYIFEVDSLFTIEKPMSEDGLWKVALRYPIPKRKVDYLSQKRDVLQVISVSHRSGDSHLEFLTEELYVDYYGNYNPSKELLLYGALAKKRVGDMLPLNYEGE